MQPENRKILISLLGAVAFSLAGWVFVILGFCF
jgi:hypothetical protein